MLNLNLQNENEIDENKILAFHIGACVGVGVRMHSFVKQYCQLSPSGEYYFQINSFTRIQIK